MEQSSLKQDGIIEKKTEEIKKDPIFRGDPGIYAGIEIASLLLGIFSLLFSPVVGIGLIPGIIGFITSLKAKKDPYCTRMADTGLILSIVGIAISLIILIIFGFFLITWFSNR